MSKLDSSEIEKANFASKEQRKFLFKFFLDTSKEKRSYFWSAACLQVFAISMQQLAYLFIISKILRDLSKRKQIESIEPYIKLIILLTVIELVALSARRLATYLEERFDTISRRAIIGEIYNRLLEHPAYFHQTKFVGVTINLISKCSDCFGRSSGIFVFPILSTIVVFIGTGVILIPIMPMYFLVMIIAGAIYLTVYLKFLPHHMFLSAQASDASSKLYGAIADGIGNIAAVKAESNEDLEHVNVNELGDTWVGLNKKFARRVLLKDYLVVNSINRSLRILCVLFAVILAVGNYDGATNIFLATTLTLAYTEGLWTLGDAIYELTLAYGEAAPMVPLLLADVAVADEKGAKDVGKVEGNIELRNIAFKYPNATSNVFQNLNLNIKQGERIGFVGKSGAGKSTLVKLIMRFVDPVSGDITIDGQSIYSITQESLRRNISYVAQEPMLFHRSVYENITYSCENVSPENIEDVLVRSYCKEFISDLPGGLESIVGERGVNLSGGQRQRIAIARAMLKNAPILILDEATSALDSESEHFVQDAFANLMSTRTTLVVAHRLSTLLNMNRIVVLDQGAISEQGTHDELVKNGGIYSGLWEHQRGGFIS